MSTTFSATAAGASVATFAFSATATAAFLVTIAFSATASGAQTPAPEDSFVAFESGQVRPLAISPDGSRLFAVNTPDNRLEVFEITASGLQPAFSVAVGLEPVAVAARSDEEVWVVNHLSDSVSIVHVGARPHVAGTLLVGDEPRDIVFAGPGRSRAFITAAHRGQNRPGSSDLTTPGTGRADIWVFDAAWRDASLGGTPLQIVTLFGDTPRALATSPDGSGVYAAVFHSGNQTTTVGDDVVCDGGSDAGPCVAGATTVPGGLPSPNQNFEGAPAPETGLIVRFDRSSQQWNDELGRSWNAAVRFSLPDYDVFRLNAASLAVEQSYSGVGTVLMAMAVHPLTGTVYVSNTEARNEVRFEGARTTGTSVRGHLHEARITVLDGEEVRPRHLNSHLDYTLEKTPPRMKRKSLATPMEMAVSIDGGTLYVAAFGSSRIGVFDTGELEEGTFVPSRRRQISVSGGGPTGLVLDPRRQRLYALTRFDNGISIIDTAAREEIAHVTMLNPEPAHIVEGRPFLYDARKSSSNGEASCSSCHVFGDTDHLAWDLGDPDGQVLPNFNDFHVGDYQDFHPMKGPMTTQSLRGMSGNGPLHWRGDRTGATTPAGDSHDVKAGFLAFLPAFRGLLGRENSISAQNMDRFADFAIRIVHPPNPVRALDDSLTEAQQRGRDVFFGRRTDNTGFNCNGCHVLSRSKKQFGTDGSIAIQSGPQLFKIPHLRNLYQKVGMFGRPRTAGFPHLDDGWAGEQIRGFGFLHDGSSATIADLVGGKTFHTTEEERADLEQFLLVFDADLAPVVGQQVTLRRANQEAASARLDLLVARAELGECDLVARGMRKGSARSWLMMEGGTFRSDHAQEPQLSAQRLRSQAVRKGRATTFTCVPPGSGMRIGIDRDRDGVLDRDEPGAAP
ncbi:MAG TPA: hypothetical protein VEL28_21455 [Candidatus Binatia bacterium]|nr:hypothetical protein [Candidatus Binatia bacterium]